MTPAHPEAEHPLRIVHVVLGLEVGGLERVVLDLVRFADRRRFEPSVLSLTSLGPIAEHVAALGVRVDAIEASTRAGAIVPLMRHLRVVGPDILHTHNPRPHHVGAIARALGCSARLIHTKHGRNPGGWRGALANKLASACSDAIVAVSADAAEVARRIEGIASGKITVVTNGVDTALFRPPPQRSVRPHPHAICVARLSPEKDHSTLLRAARRIVEAQPHFRLDLVGDGMSRPDIERLRAELGLNDRVSLVGAQERVERLMPQADLFVMASVSEGLSLTILEAMACGLPVVVTDVGGNREIVVHGETGLLVPPRDAEALAEAVLTLLRDPDRRLSMGRAARLRAEACFDIRQMVAAYERLYLDVAHGSRQLAR